MNYEKVKDQMTNIDKVKVNGEGMETGNLNI